jgi:predicted CoA-binding protein
LGAKALWLQLAIVSREARGIRGSAGMDYIEDERTAIFQRRLAGWRGRVSAFVSEA